MERKKSQTFAPGFPCFLRSTHNIPVLIREERGPQQWTVEYLDPMTGQPSGVQRDASSQQLRKCKAFESHPLIQSPPATESENHLVAMVCIGDHDTVKNSETSGSKGRPKKFRCVICQTDTRHVCSHPTCRAMKRSSGLLGTPLCNHVYRVRGVLGKTTGLTCLEIHRKRLREAKVAAPRRVVQGLSMKRHSL